MASITAVLYILWFSTLLESFPWLASHFTYNSYAQDVTSAARENLLIILVRHIN